MSQTAELYQMNASEKITALRDMLGINQNRFSQLIGVAPSTMTRLERGTPNKPSQDTLQKIADTFNEVTIEWLENDQDESMPAALTMTNERPIAQNDHEGKRLRRFVERHKPTLNQELIGKEIGVSRNQVGAYYNTERFRQNVRINILKALGKLLDRNVTPEEVFGEARTAATSVPTNLIAVPRLSVADRPKLDAKYLDEVQSNFMPSMRPETAMYAPKQAVSVEQHKRAYAIEVGNSDRMEPLYFTGYWLLGLALEPADYSRLFDGSVAIVTSDGEFLLKRVIANNLRTTGVLELGSFTTERGGTVQLRKSDIQLMFSIPGIIYGLNA